MLMTLIGRFVLMTASHHMYIQYHLHQYNVLLTVLKVQYINIIKIENVLSIVNKTLLYQNKEMIVMILVNITINIIIINIINIVCHNVLIQHNIK